MAAPSRIPARNHTHGTPDLRPAASAGTFYPAFPGALQDEVDALLRDVPASTAGRPPKALIVPHAGYHYSGPVAATAYARLARFGERVRRVILIGPAHYVHFAGLALPGASAFDTPLGAVPVDTDALASIPQVPALADAHAREHSLEVQLPFLQRVLPRFTIVPLVAGEGSAEVAAVLQALWGGPETLIVISSDLSHYLPYEVARHVDEATARSILALGRAPLYHDQACGATPVNGLVAVARRRGLRPELLDLRSAGDTEGSRERVVGYGAFAFSEETGNDA